MQRMWKDVIMTNHGPKKNSLLLHSSLSQTEVRLSVDLVTVLVSNSVIFRLRVVPLSLSPSSVTRKKTARKKRAARNPGGEDFFSRSFLSRHAHRTKRKRDYS